MTSLLPPDTRRRGPEPPAPRAPRPLALIAAAGGMAAAAGPLVVLLGVGVVGWFLADGGAHGAPRDGLRSGALVWLAGHGSGVTVQGAAVTAVPLGVTVLAAWVVWRIARRAGEMASPHGPDAPALADGARDWTVPLATGLFAASYAAVAVLVCAVAATPATQPSQPRVLVWSLALGVLVAGPAIAVGSGRMATWASLVPLPVRACLAALRGLLLTWFLVSGLVLAIAFLLDLSTAANISSQLGAGPGDLVMLGLLMLLVVPNAMAFSSAYVLGPGFSLGVGTLVTPQVAVVGALPLVPLLAALPDDGAAPGWVAWLSLLPVLVAALSVGRAQLRVPTLRWEESLLRGCGAGVLAGLVVALLSGLSGGAVGPGRMREVGPQALDVLVHAVTAFGLGGLLGAVAVTVWQRRRAAAEEMSDSGA